ncbi:MAG: formate dehydrogenase subunit gamma [Rubrivivax sp.]|nr:formate dehydrogenase subunit gamma [Rubrivivax sp.]
MLRGVAVVLLAMLVSAGNVAAQKALPPADPPPPAGAANGLPQPGESNAERGKTQPGNNAPFWRAVRESGSQAGYVSLPGLEMGQLVQEFVKYPGSQYTTAGEAWRQVRNVWLIPYGGALMLIMLLAVVLHYVAKGPMKVKAPATGRMIERFTPMERAAHWAGAITFVVLAVSGIVMAFGKFFLLPVLGLTLFGWLTYALKTLHNVVGPLFAVSMLIVIATFVKDNLPRRHDLTWLSKAGSFLGGAHVASHRFNAGEKFMFWGGVLVLGLVTAGSGLVLDQLIPQVAPTRGNMQIAHMIHGVSSVLMMAMFTGHIYMGTVGVKGAYGAMRHGYVDEAWAKEHHELWHDDIKAGRIPAQRSANGAPPADAAGARA